MQMQCTCITNARKYDAIYHHLQGRNRDLHGMVQCVKQLVKKHSLRD